MTFHAVGALDDLWEGEMKGTIVEGLPVLLVNVRGEVRAYEDRCAHQGVALSEGRLEGFEIVCRAHEWRYDARTGQGTNPLAARLRALPVRIDGGRILVDPGDRREGRP